MIRNSFVCFWRCSLIPRPILRILRGCNLLTSFAAPTFPLEKNLGLSLPSRTRNLPTSNRLNFNFCRNSCFISSNFMTPTPQKANFCSFSFQNRKRKSNSCLDANIPIFLQNGGLAKFSQQAADSAAVENRAESKNRAGEGSKTTAEDEEEREAELRREKLKRNARYGTMCMAGFTVGGVLVALYVYGAPPVDSDGKIIQDEFSTYSLPAQYLLRTWKEIRYWNMFIKEPSREKLLPEPLKDPYYQPKYTLVIEMIGVLVHPEWTYGTGWRFKKRPAVEYFLSQVGYPNFEVVIYTVESGMTAMPILESLDPQMLIMYKLFKDTTKYERGHHIKDLSKLNRDLSKVIFVEWDPQGFKLQPENALRMPKWEGDDQDTSLVDLAELLKMILTSDVDDVRPIVQYYSSFDNPAREFRQRSQRMMQAEADTLKAIDKPDSLTKSYAGKLFGYRRH